MLVFLSVVILVVREEGVWGGVSGKKKLGKIRFESRE